MTHPNSEELMALMFPDHSLIYNLNTFHTLVVAKLILFNGTNHVAPLLKSTAPFSVHEE